MKYRWLENRLREFCRPDEPYSYASPVEEALHLCLLASSRKETIVVVKDTPFLAARLAELLTPYFAQGEVLSYTPEESLRSEAIAASYENRAEAIFTLYQLLQKAPRILVTSPYGILRHLPAKEVLLHYTKTLRVGECCEREELISFLKEGGYERVSHIDKPLSYAVRGSILDVFSVNSAYPWRIEFFDDEIDSLREFTLSSQETLRTLETISLSFAKDVFFTAEEKAELKQRFPQPSGAMEMDLNYILADLFTPKLYVYTSYFPRAHLLDYFTDPLVVLSDSSAIDRHVQFLKEDTFSYIEEAAEAGECPLRFSLFAEMEEVLRKKKTLTVEPYDVASGKITEVDLPLLPIREIGKILSQQQQKVIVLGLPDKEYREVKECFQTEGIPFAESEDELREGLNLVVGDFPQGFEIVPSSLAVYGTKELFRTHRRRSRFTTVFDQALVLQSFEELQAGDYVVHDQYGIGQYVGIRQRENAGIRQDYLHIAYAGSDVLLVPLHQFSLVRKYVSKEGVIPRLHKIGSKQWQKTREKVEADVAQLAKKLVENFLLREKDNGFAFSPDSDLQKEFEAEFPYELTVDQEKAIAEVKKDMEDDRPMDRLLCGDVGFGKTEVALRAAFKAVVDKKQVAYLCPTTILSLQHFKTFAERLLNYPVEVALLNRFTGVAEERRILQRLREGKVDIVIGTHRLLSQDVVFKDLGLLIIDEEQRFGVEHKEKMKDLKKTVDFLSLSATPIPRTLQMSLIGIYGLSTLDTPPRNRYPIQTYVVEKNKGLIREAILRELERGGQVFYLHNDISQILSLAKQLQEEIPYSKVAVVHGQMSKEEIEEVMMHFYEGETNILLCTTIIETGIDIPNANTILVEHAESFGLSQLYQIKGRVGRSDRVAYAYLLVPQKKVLSEKSAKRLEAIKEFTALGSGYKIAMRDLAIRGAGDLLGDKQSGFIDNVGLDLYLSLLSEAIRKEKGECVAAVEARPNFTIPLSSYIPEDFSYNDYDKLSIYHRLDDIRDHKSLQEYQRKLRDEYGRLPKEVLGLFDKKRMEILVEKKEIESVKTVGNLFRITLSKETSQRTDGYKLFAYCNKISKDIKIQYTKDRLVLVTANRREEVQRLLKLTEELKRLEKADAH